jgi:hypothetical protein
MYLLVSQRSAESTWCIPTAAKLQGRGPVLRGWRPGETGALSAGCRTDPGHGTHASGELLDVCIRDRLENR